MMIIIISAQMDPLISNNRSTINNITYNSHTPNLLEGNSFPLFLLVLGQPHEQQVEGVIGETQNPEIQRLIHSITTADLNPTINRTGNINI
jgi:hypothetical protein